MCDSSANNNVHYYVIYRDHFQKQSCTIYHVLRQNHICDSSAGPPARPGTRRQVPRRQQKQQHEKKAWQQQKKSTQTKSTEAMKS